MVRNFMQTDCPRCGKPRWGPHQQEGCPMTKEMWEALIAYRKENGYRWKTKLTTAWTRGEDLGEHLQQVRNAIGPTRLYKLKLPKEGLKS